MLILIVAGDPSGDVHGAKLIAELKRGGARVAAVGGPLMKLAADEFLEDLASRGVTGFWEPAAKLGFLLKLGLRLRRFMSERRPDAVVCIDFYGFNRRVLGLAYSAKIPAFYYISPQVWASRPGRVNVLKRLVRRMFVIFPFEETLYTKAGLPCSFVGHPLLDSVPPPREDGALGTPLTVGLLPGSRAAEVRKHLPLFLESFRLFKRHLPDSRALVFAADNLPDTAYALPPDVELVRESDYKRRRMTDLVLSSSGTATLENALLALPMVVIYKLSWPTYLIARAIIKVPYIAMVNILAGKALVPELIQHEATAPRIAQAAVRLLEDPRRHEALRCELKALRACLGEPGGAARAAAMILAESRP